LHYSAKSISSSRCTGAPRRRNRLLGHKNSLDGCNQEHLKVPKVVDSGKRDSKRTCCVTGKVCIILFKAFPPASVYIHLGQGKGSKNTATQFSIVEGTFWSHETLK
jgi:hypothetical protein